jgi:hypothetical protein
VLELNVEGGSHGFNSGASQKGKSGQVAFTDAQFGNSALR